MFRRPILFVLLITLACSLRSVAAIPPELEQALKLFRTEGAPGWAYLQTTEAGGKSLVEHYNPAKPEFARWTLLKKDGAAPTDAEIKDYKDRLSRRTNGGTAPNVKDQIDPASGERISAESDRITYRFRLKPGGGDDRSAEHMTAQFTLHQPTATIERVELSSIEPFSPMFTIKINEAKTTMIYSLPTADRPTLLQQITLRIRGRAMWFKSLDQDMVVTYSAHEFTGKKPTATPAPPENPARAATATP